MFASDHCDPLLRVSHLSVDFESMGRSYCAVTDCSFIIARASIVALVGESGCGKSLTARAILRLPPPNAVVRGQIFFEGTDILTVPAQVMQSLRGKAISMIFQEPQSALNPVIPIGRQAAEVLRVHAHCSQKEAMDRVCAMFTQVGIPNAELRLASYPHELSGGMRQRVLIAMSLLCNPKLLIADEPTTALDPTIRQQILHLLLTQSRARGTAILCISHDLELVHSFAEYVGVLYAGRLVEFAKSTELFAHPLHPYTQGLLASSPAKHIHAHRLPTIPGTVPRLHDLPTGCPFAPRCQDVLPVCHQAFPTAFSPSSHHRVFCWRLH
ncbi:MAG: ABC transporter ATP-binding protein [Desulfovibrio sp.]|nr:ABC transporter ATP-binding protein [Desulfovibrio sp.]